MSALASGRPQIGEGLDVTDVRRLGRLLGPQAHLLAWFDTDDLVGPVCPGACRQAGAAAEIDHEPGALNLCLQAQELEERRRRRRTVRVVPRREARIRETGLPNQLFRVMLDRHGRTAV